MEVFSFMSLGLLIKSTKNQSYFFLRRNFLFFHQKNEKSQNTPKYSQNTALFFYLKTWLFFSGVSWKISSMTLIVNSHFAVSMIQFSRPSEISLFWSKNRPKSLRNDDYFFLCENSQQYYSIGLLFSLVIIYGLQRKV